jgi:ABC-type Fe3+ transport system permease subunit
MALDGVRALVVGSYFTPGSGEHAGELGPWARLVSAVGIEPESAGMKSAFVVFGAAWLTVAVGIAVQAEWAWVTGVVLAVGTLWYLVPGTVISVAVLVLLLTPAGRRALGRE